MARPKIKFYAVAIGRQRGIFEDWEHEAKPMVEGYSNARHRSFPTRAEAEIWLENQPLIPPPPSTTSCVSLSASSLSPGATDSSIGQQIQKITNGKAGAAVSLPASDVTTSSSIGPGTAASEATTNTGAGASGGSRTPPEKGRGNRGRGGTRGRGSRRGRVGPPSLVSVQLNFSNTAAPVDGTSPALARPDAMGAPMSPGVPF